MFYDPAAKLELSGADIRNQHPHISFPPEISIEHAAELGYAELEYDPQPELAPGEQLRPGEIRQEDGRYFQAWAVAPAPAPTAEDIADRRWQAETAGIAVSGMRIETDDRSKLLINGAALEAVIDPGYVMQWKTPEGFIPLGAEQVIGVARAVRAHVQACFNREAELLDALEAGTFTPEMLEEGWPNEPISEPTPS